MDQLKTVTEKQLTNLQGQGFAIHMAVNNLTATMDQLKILAAKPLVNEIKQGRSFPNIQDAEFQVFSQFGDDGIIQYLIHNVEITSRRFIEFGVESYREANTRFLLINDNWEGLIIDGSEQNMSAVKGTDIYWRHTIEAVSAFIDKDNINDIFRKANFLGDIGIMSVDVDGNDYWILESIDTVSPTILICEYNSTFGGKRAVSIPYDPTFERNKAHFSNLYWGCSLAALEYLAAKKGYSFVGSNSNGNNAYFVRTDRLGKIKPMSAERGYMKAMFRESRDASGGLTFVGPDKRLDVIADMPLIEVTTGTTLKARELK
ncbi:MAG TPA: hypothetical protein V6C97_08870 [Oculatellaceae cyanobacterium]